MYMNTKIKVLILFLCLIAPVSYVVPKTVVHPWKNKKVAFFGDSITDPNIKTKGTDSKGRTPVTRINDKFMEQLLTDDTAMLAKYNAISSKKQRQSASNVLPILMEKGLVPSNAIN